MASTAANVPDIERQIVIKENQISVLLGQNPGPITHNAELPESASLLQTRGVCQQVTEILKRHEPIQSAAVFAGGTAPRFFIAVSPKENAS